jgi:hypothetical protein
MIGRHDGRPTNGTLRIGNLNGNVWSGTDKKS